MTNKDFMNSQFSLKTHPCLIRLNRVANSLRRILLVGRGFFNHFHNFYYDQQEKIFKREAIPDYRKPGTFQAIIYELHAHRDRGASV